MSTNSYCPQCGEALEVCHVEGRSRDYCVECDCILYRNPKPCAGVVVVDGPKVLLVKRTEPPAVGSWSLPAGFLEADEPPATAAVRELTEETSLSVAEADVTLHDTSFVERSADEFVLVVIYAAPRSATTGRPAAGSDATEARFWNLDELRAHPDESIEPGYFELFATARDALAVC
jgi:ADP-ribose pyrophosphatase YjhB (NUDIX family)